MTDVPANDNALGSDERRATVTAATDLEALTTLLTPLFGTAVRLVHVRGGVRDDGLTDKTLALLPLARRALARLSALRASAHGALHARVLIAHYIYAGEARRADRWLDTLRLSLLPRQARTEALVAVRGARSGPHARAALAAGQRLLAEAELAYLHAPEWVTDGRWLLIELEDISRALLDVARDQIAVVRAARAGRSTKPTQYPPADDSNGHSCGDSCDSKIVDTEHLTLSGQRDTTMTSAQLRLATAERPDAGARGEAIESRGASGGREPRARSRRSNKESGR